MTAYAKKDANLNEWHGICFYFASGQAHTSIAGFLNFQRRYSMVVKKKATTAKKKVVKKAVKKVVKKAPAKKSVKKPIKKAVSTKKKVAAKKK